MVKAVITMCRFAFFAAALAGLAVPAFGADTHHEATANSSATIDVKPDGTVTIHARNARLIPYAFFDGTKHWPRLATVTTDVGRRTDAEGDDPSSTVSVTVDDMSGDSPKRLATFSDPGSDGAMLGESYFDTRQPGCCGGPDVHSVHTLEDGKLLYRATGDGETGSSAWAIAPNAGPRMVRWASFDGRVEENAVKFGTIGFISYGNLDGALSKLVVKIEPKTRDAEDMNLGMSHVAKLVWLDAATQKSGRAPASGTAEDPENIWSLDKVASADKIGGFSVRLGDYDGHTLATIPIVADRLDTADAKLAKGVALSEAPH